MSLINCKECKKEHSSSAKACPHCGYVRTTGCLKVIAWFIGIMVLISIWTSIEDNKNKEVADIKEKARIANLTPMQIAAENEVKERESRFSASRGACMISLKQALDDPASAEFGIMKTWYSEDRKDGTVLIQPSFRAKNKYGALVNTTWDCVVKPEGENVRVLSLKQIRP